MGKTIAFSGYRTEKLPENVDPIRIQLKKEVNKCIEDGYDTFLCGMAEGLSILQVLCKYKIVQKNLFKWTELNSVRFYIIRKISTCQ